MSQRERLVSIAASQIGAAAPTGDDKFIKWFNEKAGTRFDLDTTPWCSIFVCWCLTMAEASDWPLTASCTAAMNWYKQRGQWRERWEHIPRPGDIIYFDWDGSGDADHVGIVAYCDGERVETIEGNTADAVKRRSYELLDMRIRGYGLPTYSEEETMKDPKGNTPSEWAREACAWAVEKGYFKGDENGDMHWQDPLTREQFAVILKRVMGE